MYCKNCGTEMPDGNTYCHKCGHKNSNDEHEYYERGERSKPISGMCIAGFVVSIASFFITLYGFMPAVSLIFSLLGIDQASKRDLSLKGLGVAGLIISIVVLAYTLYSFLILDALLTSFLS